MRALLLPFLLAFCATTHAQVELAIGSVDEIDGRRGETLMVSWLNGRQHPFELFAGYLRREQSVLGSQYSSTAFVGAGHRIYWRGFYLATGIVLLQRETPSLTSRGQFLSGFGYGDGRLSIAIRHLSNANTGGRNRGENLITLSWRW